MAQDIGPEEALKDIQEQIGNVDTVFFGRVKSFKVKTGYGFLSCPEAHAVFGRDVFIHKKQMGELLGHSVGPTANREIKMLDPYVRFEVKVNRDGMPQARHVCIVQDELKQTSCDSTMSTSSNTSSDLEDIASPQSLTGRVSTKVKPGTPPTADGAPLPMQSKPVRGKLNRNGPQAALPLQAAHRLQATPKDKDSTSWGKREPQLEPSPSFHISTDCGTTQHQVYPSIENQAPRCPVGASGPPPVQVEHPPVMAHGWKMNQETCFVTSANMATILEALSSGLYSPSMEQSPNCAPNGAVQSAVIPAPPFDLVLGAPGKQLQPPDGDVAFKPFANVKSLKVWQLLEYDRMKSEQRGQKGEDVMHTQFVYSPVQ